VNPIEEELRNFLMENFAIVSDAPPIGNTESLIETGIVDSTGLLELVSFIETRYGLEIPDQDLLPENFETIANISTYVASRMQTDSVSAGADL
jgi:acyl carrier protein